MDTCNEIKIDNGTRNVVFACNNIFVASKLLNDKHPDVSDLLIKLASTLLATVPEDETQNIQLAVNQIEALRNEQSVR